MATTNPVFQVLVTKGNQALAAKNTPISALLNGQLGVYNYHTGLALDATSTAAEASNFFIAVGGNRINTAAAAALEDINFSAGQLIQAPTVQAYNNRNYTAPLPNVWTITNYKIYSEAEYIIKIEFRNQNVYALNGYNQFTKTFSQLGGCASGTPCTNCGGDGDCNEFTVQMIDQINAEPDGLVVAEAIDYTTTPGTNIVVTDIPTWVADPANAGLCLGIQLTSVPEKIFSYCNINLKYFNPRGTVLIVSLTEGFTCNGVATETQEVGYEEGLGYDIRDLEFQAGGWNGRPGPYRVSELIGTAREGFFYFTDTAAKYTQVTLTYDVWSQSNFEKYQANTSTIIAIPCADNTTRTAFIALLDHILTQFPPNAGNAALEDCSGTDHTNDYPAANNGIKILA